MGNRRFLSSLAAAGFALLSLGGIAQARDVQHELGTTNVPDEPKRIVVLEFSFIDSLAAVGVAPVGLTDDNKPERITEQYRAIIGNDFVSVGTRKSPSLEMIASLQPDLIIADKTRHSSAYKSLSAIAPTIVLDSLTGDYHSALEQAQVIGDAIGKSEEMKARVAAHTARFESVKANVANAKKEGRTFQFGVVSSRGLYLHAPHSYNGSLLMALGLPLSLSAEGAGVSYESAYVKTSLEQLSEINPGVLLLGRYSENTVTDQWKDEPLYKAVTAVKEEQVYYVSGHNWARLRGIVASELTFDELEAALAKVAEKTGK
ncbi:ABC transporter substrate-binding protein [Polycladidibacter hongkongensis]|uniref:ABC transporter substrate-binding protein n=1 Tax=Polycladidibacter hongkongensis TaxID=1647556 RepID=UPI00082DC3CC|nr:Fe(3+) dicitrate ABC transporter substrate-binding protein [Pseudovibrio hongkongensis]